MTERDVDRLRAQLEALQAVRGHGELDQPVPMLPRMLGLTDAELEKLRDELEAARAGRA